MKFPMCLYLLTARHFFLKEREIDSVFLSKQIKKITNNIRQIAKAQTLEKLNQDLPDMKPIDCPMRSKSSWSRSRSSRNRAAKSGDPRDKSDGCLSSEGGVVPSSRPKSLELWCLSRDCKTCLDLSNGGVEDINLGLLSLTALGGRPVGVPAELLTGR